VIVSKFWRGVFVVLAFFFTVMGLLTLQFFFDRGDIKRASRVIYEYKPAGQEKTLTALIADEIGISEESLICESALISRYEGRVHVGCHGSEPKPVYEWEVNVVAAIIKPRNGYSQQLMNSLKSGNEKEND
jgi:hypothetical protein